MNTTKKRMMRACLLVESQSLRAISLMNEPESGVRCGPSRLVIYDVSSPHLSDESVLWLTDFRVLYNSLDCFLELLTGSGQFLCELERNIRLSRAAPKGANDVELRRKPGAADCTCHGESETTNWIIIGEIRLPIGLDLPGST